jgi:hypothetical protein
MEKEIKEINDMKKLLVFSLLLLAMAVMVGCGADSKWTPPNATRPGATLTAPTSAEVKSGASLTLNFTCANSAILPIAHDGIAAMTRVDSCGLNFTANDAADQPLKPGFYNISATTILAPKPTATVKVTVVPDLQVSGKAKIAPGAEQQFTPTGAGVAASLAAGSVVTWSFESEDHAVGSIDENTGLFTAGILGKGTVTATMIDEITGKTVTVELDIKVAKGLQKPEALAGFNSYNWYWANIDTFTVGYGVGLWGDRDGPWSISNPALDGADITIPDRAYVYNVPFGGSFPANDAIEGYTKVSITDGDYSVLKAGQWATITLTPASNYIDWTGQYVVIIPYEFVP